MRTSFLLVIFGLAITAVPAGAADTSWQSFADCSTAYRIDSLDAQLNKGRSDSMKQMIRDQATDYRTAAIGAYAKAKKLSPKAATAPVDAYLKTNGKRIMPLARSGNLEQFIDRCPQIP